jgi:hypothetical protein
MLKSAGDSEQAWPDAAVLLCAALILLAGLGVAVARGPAQGGEVRVEVFPDAPPQP